MTRSLTQCPWWKTGLYAMVLDDRDRARDDRLHLLASVRAGLTAGAATRGPRNRPPPAHRARIVLVGVTEAAPQGRFLIQHYKDVHDQKEPNRVRPQD